MAAMRNDRDENIDVELLAQWLNGAIRTLYDGQAGYTMLRRIVQEACKQADEMYGTKNETDEDLAEDNAEGMVSIRHILAKFASALDENERLRAQMDKEEGQ